MENRKTSPVSFLIDFFASLYDFVIDLFASIYDLAYDSVIFLWDYLKWITTISSVKSDKFKSHVEEPIKVNYNKPF